MTPLHHPYRRDIDGLRAVAIAGIVLAHAGTTGFAGGFAGIDVFFVVSGYLLAKRFVEDPPSDGRALLRFWGNRIGRLCPALFVMLVTSAITAGLLLPPADFIEFGKSLVAATLFVSNLWFWPSVELASDRANLIPLLHTWAISAGVQIWLMLSAALFIVHRWAGSSYRLWLSILFAVSLALSVGSAQIAPEAGFLLSPTRAWEFFLGALLAVGVVPHVANHTVREALGALGLWLVAWSFISFSAHTPFPGYAALAPCLGAAFLIHAGQTSTPTAASRLLSFPPIAFHGLIAYSLYLWHWPILVFARHWNGAPLSGAQTAFLVAVSVVVAIASWAVIERPFRSGRMWLTLASLRLASAATMLLLITFGLAASSRAGWPGRFNNYRQPVIAGAEALKTGRCLLAPEQGPWNYAGLTRCETGDEGARAVVIWGDSYAAHLVPGLSRLAGEDLGVAQYTADGCPPILGMEVSGRPNCRAFNNAALRVIDEAAPDIVVLAADWRTHLARLDRNLSALQGTVDELRALGYIVLLVGQSPSFDFRTPSDWVSLHKSNIARVNFGPEVREALARIEGVAHFDPMAELCDGLQCQLRDERNGYIYMDRGHLSARGSARIASILLPVLARLAFTGSPSAATADNGRSGAD